MMGFFVFLPIKFLLFQICFYVVIGGVLIGGLLWFELIPKDQLIHGAKTLLSLVSESLGDMAPTFLQDL